VGVFVGEQAGRGRVVGGGGGPASGKASRQA
jgi:hypothetical protein